MDQTGYFEEVNGGTLFLDEFNSMSLSMQSKLLRDFQKGFFYRMSTITINLPPLKEHIGDLEELGLHRQGMQYRIKKYGIIF